VPQVFGQQVGLAVDTADGELHGLLAKRAKKRMQKVHY
jgi:hypothetical protein